MPQADLFGTVAPDVQDFRQPAPTGDQSRSTPSPKRRARLNWKRISILTVLGTLLVVGGLALLGSVEKNLDVGGAFGVPKDFPVYPNAALSGVHENFSPSGTRVTAAWEADAPLDVVTGYYVERLDQGSWQITGKNTVEGTWEFRHTDGKIHGYIQLSGHGQRTRVDVLLLK
jgi:hypothetical protein